MAIARRRFLQTAAAGSFLKANATRLESDVPEPQAATPPSDQVTFAIIGVGMQGSGLMGASLSLPGIRCAGAADLYDGRHTLAREIAGNPSLPVTRHYQELLDRKDVDCIVAAVPD